MLSSISVEPMPPVLLSEMVAGGNWQVAMPPWVIVNFNRHDAALSFKYARSIGIDGLLDLGSIRRRRIRPEFESPDVKSPASRRRPQEAALVGANRTGAIQDDCPSATESRHRCDPQVGPPFGDSRYWDGHFPRAQPIRRRELFRLHLDGLEQCHRRGWS